MIKLVVYMVLALGFALTAAIQEESHIVFFLALIFTVRAIETLATDVLNEVRRGF